MPQYKRFMEPNTHDPIVSSRRRGPLTSRERPPRNLWLMASICMLFLAAESLLLRSQFRLDYFSTYSLFDTVWSVATLCLVALWFCLLMPRAVQLLCFTLQLPVNIFILGSFSALQELPTYGAIHHVLTSPGLLEQVFSSALSMPSLGIIFLLSGLKCVCAFLSPPFVAKKRLPPGTILFMFCCITLVPAQQATLSVLSTTRSPTYKIMATASIERHGYILTWLAEAKSRTWRDCYVAPEKS